VPELLVPKLNNNDADYVLTDWLAPDGTPVSAGAPIAVVETSKAAEELEADTTGVLHPRLPAGARCRPGEPIAFIADGTAPAAPAPAGPAAAPSAEGPLVTRPAQALMDELDVTLAEVAALGVPVVKREHVQSLRGGSAAAPAAATAGAPAAGGAPAPAGGSLPPAAEAAGERQADGASAAAAVAAPGAGAAGARGPAPAGPAGAGTLPAESAGGAAAAAAVSAARAGGPAAAGTAPAAAGSPAGGERVELGRVQLGVARAVRLSHQSIPAAYTVVRMDLSGALAYGAAATRKVRRPVGLAELFVREVAGLQRDFPRFFAAVDEDGRSATLAEAAHIGVTVDLGEGLYVPCVRDAADRTLGEIATQLMSYRIAATKGTFRERDLVGANFVVTLHTDADVVLAVPFVLPGTVCALAVTSPADGSAANIGLAYDHRLINGRDASLFLHALRTSMEGLTA
jgi:2-oxoglutarate dehydrogenase E2 component (dihydrolipoamide succinyltransferase)